MTYLQAIWFGILQGVTEPFPISSLGHSVILPTLVGWHVHEKDPLFLVFLVATHTATALVFFIIFWKDWMKIFSGLWVSLKKRTIDPDNVYGKLGWLLVVGTIPAGLVGLLFEKFFRRLFAAPELVAGMLALNGIMLIAADLLRKRKEKITDFSGEASDLRLAKLSWGQSLKVGLSQVLALVPGFSRTGSTMTGGLLTGLSYGDAARFSFLLATPIIGAASALKLPELALRHSSAIPVDVVLIGAVVAGLSSWVSVKFLLKYFETKKLWPLGIYCFILGTFTLSMFLGK
ncbi:MAG: undecaprenyl-diphosphate phosphatase [Bacteroidetes bacterium]|jgi:undecaprenyl-diphosphatase|nr:undecaprenyl-diphosphate phosphatase [Bacteroidota bacterium]